MSDGVWQVSFANTKFEISKDYSAHYTKKLQLGGLCCSFAMDFAKKRLANKQVDATTYDTKARIKKIAKRQALQNKPNMTHLQGLKAVAKAYGMKLVNDNPVFTGRRPSEGYGSYGATVYAGNYNKRGVFYVSVSFSFDGHGFCVDNRQKPSWLADNGAGIYCVNTAVLAEIVKAHIDLFEKNDMEVVLFECYELQLS